METASAAVAAARENHAPELLAEVGPVVQAPVAAEAEPEEAALVAAEAAAAEELELAEAVAPVMAQVAVENRVPVVDTRAEPGAEPEEHAPGLMTVHGVLTMNRVRTEDLADLKVNPPKEDVLAVRKVSRRREEDLAVRKIKALAVVEIAKVEAILPVVVKENMTTAGAVLKPMIATARSVNFKAMSSAADVANKANLEAMKIARDVDSTPRNQAVTKISVAQGKMLKMSSMLKLPEKSQQSAGSEALIQAENKPVRVMIAVVAAVVEMISVVVVAQTKSSERQMFTSVSISVLLNLQKILLPSLEWKFKPISNDH